MSIKKEEVVLAEKVPVANVEQDPATRERARAQERADKVSRVHAFLDQQRTEVEELLFAGGRDEAAGNVSQWVKEKRKNFKEAVQGAPADPELSVVTLMAGLAAERNREASLIPEMDADVAKEAEQKAKFAQKIFDQEMVASIAFGTRVDTKNPGSLNDIIAQTKNAATLPVGFNLVGSNIAFVQERLRDLQQGKVSSKDVLDTVNTIFHDLNESGYSLVGNLEKLANPKTTPAEKAALLQGIEKLNKAVSALQLVRKQLEGAVYEKGAAEPAARSKIDALREAIANGKPGVSAQNIPHAAKETVPLPRSVVAEQKSEAPILSPEDVKFDSWMKGLMEGERSDIAKAEARNAFSRRQYTPLFETLTQSIGDSEKARETIRGWMSAIRGNRERLKKAGKTDFEVEKLAVKEFIESKPAHLAATLSGARAIEDARFSKFDSKSTFGKMEFNGTDEYIIGNLYLNFTKNNK